MAKYALYAELKAKPGKEAEVEAFLKQGGAMARLKPEPSIGTALKRTNPAYSASSIPSMTKPDAKRTLMERLRKL